MCINGAQKCQCIEISCGTVICRHSRSEWRPKKAVLAEQDEELLFGHTPAHEVSKRQLEEQKRPAEEQREKTDRLQ